MQHRLANNLYGNMTTTLRLMPDCWGTFKAEGRHGKQVKSNANAGTDSSDRHRSRTHQLMVAVCIFAMKQWGTPQCS